MKPTGRPAAPSGRPLNDVTAPSSKVRLRGEPSSCSTRVARAPRSRCRARAAPRSNPRSTQSALTTAKVASMPRAACLMPPPVPRMSASGESRTSSGSAAQESQSSTCRGSQWRFTHALATPRPASQARQHSSSGRFITGRRHLGRSRVRGLRRSPKPAAKTTASMPLRGRSSGRDSWRWLSMARREVSRGRAALSSAQGARPEKFFVGIMRPLDSVADHRQRRLMGLFFFKAASERARQGRRPERLRWRTSCTWRGIEGRERRMASLPSGRYCLATTRRARRGDRLRDSTRRA